MGDLPAFPGGPFIPGSPFDPLSPGGPGGPTHTHVHAYTHKYTFVYCDDFNGRILLEGRNKYEYDGQGKMLKIWPLEVTINVNRRSGFKQSFPNLQFLGISGNQTLP